MPAVVVDFCSREALTFRGKRMHNHRSVFYLLSFAESCYQSIRIVTVDIADVLESQLAYQRARQDSRGYRIFHRLCRVMQTTTQRRYGQQSLFDLFFEAMVALRFADSV